MEKKMEKNKQQPGEGVASDQTRQSDNLFIYNTKKKFIALIIQCNRQ